MWKRDIRLGWKALRLKAKQADPIENVQLGKMDVVKASNKNKALTDFRSEPQWPVRTPTPPPRLARGQVTDAATDAALEDGHSPAAPDPTMMAIKEALKAGKRREAVQLWTQRTNKPKGWEGFWPCSGRFEVVVLYGVSSHLGQFAYWSLIVSHLNREHA